MKINKLFTLFATAFMLLGVQNVNADITDVTYRALGGSNWSHGSENPTKLFDGTEDTKWGTSDDDPYIIFKASVPIQPSKYKLKIAKDTQSWNDRNWKSWRIYGGNFNSDAAATRNASSGWVLIDTKTNQTLSTTSFAVDEFTLSESVSKSYTYFRIEIDALRGNWDNYCQMDEFWFSDGTLETWTYTHVISTGTGGEGADKLIDGTNTKWGRTVTDNNPAWVVFKTSKALSATDYTLTEANDTPTNNGRNWKKWKIYGANFYSEKLVSKDAPEWVLLDEKDITNNDNFPISASNNTYLKTDFSMSENVTTKFEYFKVVVEETRTKGSYSQMGEFCFKYSSVATENETWGIKVDVAKTVGGAFDYGELDSNYPLYTELQDLIATNGGLDTALAGASGNYTTVKAKLEYVYDLQRVMTDYIGGREFSSISGSSGCWNDGLYDYLVDGNDATKWGGDIPNSDGMWMIFRAKTGIKPYFYKILTAWDAQTWAGRNWKDWKVYGGNFATMDAATHDASWTLIDEREGVGRDLLPAKNSELASFGVSSEFTENYDGTCDYFMVVVTKSYDEGTKIQMNELTLGTEEEFTTLKNEYMTDLNAYTVPDAANSQYKAGGANSYADAVALVEAATPENIQERYNTAKALQKEIFQSLKDDNDFYQITSNTDLELYSDLVNGSEPGAKGKLMTDLDLNGFKLTSIGGNSDFTGEFDGQGHTIRHLSFNDQAGWRSGMFGQANNATIHDIVFEEAHVAGRNNVGVAVGEAKGTTTIQNIIVHNSEVSVVYANSGAKLGGIVGEANGSVVIKNCAVLNSTLEAHDYAGAIAGYTLGGATVQNCFSNAVVIAQGSWAGGVAGAARTATIEKNLFTGIVRSDYDRACGLVGMFNVASGDNYTLVLRNNVVAAATLKGSNTSALMYVPNLPESQTTAVSYTGNYLWNGTGYSDGIKALNHHDDANGCQKTWKELTVESFYTDLGWNMTNDWMFIEEGLYPILKGTEDYIDYISDASELTAFSAKINGGGLSFLARLTADITAPNDYTPIGTDDNKYWGTFDGQGHIVTLAINNTSEKYQGLFGHVMGGAAFMNLIIRGSVAGKQCNGALVGEAKSEEGTGMGGTVYIDHVGCEASVSGTETDAYSGAFVGNVWGLRVNLEIIDSYNSGALSGTNVVNVVGNPNNYSKFTNVYNSGTISTNKFSHTSNGTYTNCYTTTSGNDITGLTQSVTAAQVTSGELCYNLGEAFYQALGTDDYPVLDSSKPNVYAIAVSDACYTSFVPTVNVATIPDGVTVYAGQDNGTYLHLEEVDEVPADNAFVVKATAGNYYYNNTDENRSIGLVANDLTYSPTALTSNGTQYCLANKASGVGFYQVNEGVTIPARKVYLASGSEVKAFYFDDDPDAIVSPLGETEEGVIYNLAGQRVSKLQKGINIINGKKVLK